MTTQLQLPPPQSLTVNKPKRSVDSMDSGYRSKHASASELQAIREDEPDLNLKTILSSSHLETPGHLNLPTICLSPSPRQSLTDLRRGSEDSCNSSQCPSDASTPAQCTRPLLSDKARVSGPSNKIQKPTLHSSNASHSPKTYAEEIILRETVRCEMPAFVTNTDFKELSAHLFSKRLLHEGDYATLVSLPSCKDKGNHFYMELLPRKGRHAYRRLYKCLREETSHAGHQDLFEILHKALKEGRPPRGSSDCSPTESCAAMSHPPDNRSVQCCTVQ